MKQAVCWSHEQKLEWFTKGFRPHFEVWVVNPAIGVMNLPEGGMPAFIWVTCAVDWLAGFWWGESTKNHVREAYTGFINEYFPPNRYNADDLYDSLRNGLVHMYTIKEKKYALTNRHPERHLGTDANQVILNLEDFFVDFVAAKNAYFDEVAAKPEMLDKLVTRYEREGFLGFV